MSFVESRFRELVEGAEPLPLPGGGRTLDRWRALARVAAEDLSLVKLYEGHTDALAILAELGSDWQQPAASWGTWAAEPPQARLNLRRAGDQFVLSGRKAWCSGARIVSHALVTCWDADDQQCLAAVRMDSAGVRVSEASWAAVGMGLIDSPEVIFNEAKAIPIGQAGQYVQRPGFWHGGCGIAACWYGGAVPLAGVLAEAVANRANPHAAALLGEVDVLLRSLRALLIEAAGWIDQHPSADARSQALRVRAAADRTATEVLNRVGRGIGAGPLCQDRATARRYADLPVFIRQTHAERDLAELGSQLAGAEDQWLL
ncbi:MAG: acyl-CoA dehydrogenase family protein [Jatrophihabitantaceae bacterium]